MVLLKKTWKESSSLIICGRNAKNAILNGYNYKILVMKRSSKASFMPNLTVFPGGATDPADNQNKWIDLYKSMSFQKESFQSLRPEQTARSFIFNAQHPSMEPTVLDAARLLDRDVALRLSAIRETFEELGLFIGRGKNTSDNAVVDAQISDCTIVDNVHSWQKEVHANAKTFADMCAQLEIVPDVWSLFEWANWLTPTTFGNRRFDTAFYLVALNNQPDVLAEKNEVQEFMWASPRELLSWYSQKAIDLPPPQFYEISRLSHLRNIEDVYNFCRNRNHFGTTLFYPVYYKLKDGHVFLYPGDDAYPAQPDFVGDVHDTDRYSSLTRAEFRAKSGCLHRMEHLPKRAGVEIFLNIKPHNEHLSPLAGIINKL